MVDKKIYKRALTDTLTNLSIEDMKEHGRLLTLKEKLVNLVDPQDKLDIKALSLFQLKDFSRGDK